MPNPNQIFFKANFIPFFFLPDKSALELIRQAVGQNPTIVNFGRPSGERTFGYEKGVFTGAQRLNIGRLQHADKGSLFLDEIGEMKPGLQAKLLRVLQKQVFEPIGSVKSTEIDIRVIAATNCNLEQLVQRKFQRRTHHPS